MEGGGGWLMRAISGQDCQVLSGGRFQDGFEGYARG